MTQESLTVQLCIIGENDYWSDTGASDEFRRGEQLGLLSYGTDRNFLNPEDADLLVSQASFAKRSLVDLKTEFLTNLNDDLCHFFTCLGLCNVAIPLESGEYLTTVAEDTILLELSETIGLKLTHRDRARCKIEMLDDSKEYLIWGLRDASSESKRTRIIVQNSRSDEVIVYVKGSLDTMLDILNDSHNRLPFLESILKQSQTSSLQFIVIGYRILKHKEAQEFKLGYRNAKQCPVNSERRIESVFEEIEIGAEYLGCVGIQEEITEETRNAVTVLKSAGIKI